MENFRQAKALSLPLRAYDDLIYIHPDGEKIVYGDIVIVSEGCSARFSAGGETYWFRDPQRYTIGYDNRTESEILRANLMGEDLEGLPLLVNTSLIFCRLKPLADYTLRSDEYLMINRMIGLKPDFRIRITVTDDEQLLRSISPESRAIDQVLEAIGRILKPQLQETIYPLFNPLSSPDDVRNQLNDVEFVSSFLAQLRQSLSSCCDFGIGVDSLELINWNLHSEFCETCGTPVAHRAGLCPNRHRVHRCPVCKEPVLDGMCFAHGHEILYCSACRKYVVPQNGHCRTHPEIKQTLF